MTPETIYTQMINECETWCKNNPNECQSCVPFDDGCFETDCSDVSNCYCCPTGQSCGFGVAIINAEGYYDPGTSWILASYGCNWGTRQYIDNKCEW